MFFMEIRYDSNTLVSISNQKTERIARESPLIN